MKDKIIVSEISNGILVKFLTKDKFAGEFAYHLGRTEDVKLLVDRLLNVLELQNNIEWRIK
jgi:hypothetical protein